VDLPEYLEPGDVLVRNATRVIPARLIGRRVATSGAWECLFLRELPGNHWEVLAKTRGTPGVGERFESASGLPLTLVERQAGGRWIVRPEVSGGALELLGKFGEIPLPPYIRQGRAGPEDRDRYQTLFAREPGSVAAPTAGLHFTERVFDRLRQRQVDCVDVTLHVGVGTFRPIEAESIDAHVMHPEWATLDAQAALQLNDCRQRGGRILAVGTTSTRTLESAVINGRFEPFQGETNLFIRPGHDFRGLDLLLTNFHLPRSSLLVLVAALLGVELMREVYGEAVRACYRFYSYGDAMLILP
jgi:S-adenosylmethionine:tRNA ribosyltransferase-isomerase